MRDDRDLWPNPGTAPMLAAIRAAYRPRGWDIRQDRHAWTAEKRPTATALWFCHRRTLHELERKLRRAERNAAASP
jgi:hypothetical protein